MPIDELPPLDLHTGPTMLSADPSLDDRIDIVIKNNPHLARRRIQFTTDADGVTLEGKVGSYFQKQVAQEIILRIDGVSRIDNRLQVG